MSAIHCLALLSVLCAGAPAQVQDDDLLVNLNSPSISNKLRHYRPDGTFVTENSPAFDTMTGVDILADGRWTSAYHGFGLYPSSLVRFSPTGASATWTPTPAIDDVGVGDVGAFDDYRTIVVNPQSRNLVVFDAAMNHVGTWTHPGFVSPRGCEVDALQEVWVADPGAARIWHFDSAGTFLGSIAPLVNSGLGPLDVAEAPDGTLWAVFLVAPFVRQFARDGTLLRSFDPPPLLSQVRSVAAASDGSVWVGTSARVGRLEPDGSLRTLFSAGGPVEFLKVPQGLFDNFCTPIAQNSAGGFATTSASGSRYVVDDDLTLQVDGIPPGQFGYFLVGSGRDILIPPGSQGFLCISCSVPQACPIGRFAQPAQIVVGPSGSVAVSLQAWPVPGGSVVQPGDRWHFQCWYRDQNPGPTSNWSDAMTVVFR